MAFSIVLTEDTLRSMGAPLRDALLKWYFESPLHSAEEAGEPPAVSGITAVEEGRRRVTFSELASAGLIQPGDEIYCTALKRNRRGGGEGFITGAQVTGDGSVEFQGRKFFKPSKLALSMANASGGPKPAKALNGYAYLYVQSGEAFVSLDELRRRIQNRASQTGFATTPASISASNLENGERFEAESLARLLAGQGHPVPTEKILWLARRIAKLLSRPEKPIGTKEALRKLVQSCRQPEGLGKPTEGQSSK